MAGPQFPAWHIPLKVSDLTTVIALPASHSNHSFGSIFCFFIWFNDVSAAFFIGLFPDDTFNVVLFLLKRLNCPALPAHKPQLTGEDVQSVGVR